MNTLQRFHTGQDKSYNVRLMRAARRLASPKRSAVYTTPLKKAWSKEVKRVRAARGSARRIRLFVGIGAGILAFNAAITALVLVLRRFTRQEMEMVESEEATTETTTMPEDATEVIEFRETVLA